MGVLFLFGFIRVITRVCVLSFSACAGIDSSLQKESEGREDLASAGVTPQGWFPRAVLPAEHAVFVSVCVFFCVCFCFYCFKQRTRVR